MTITETPFDAADRVAPIPATREDATREAWVRYYAAQALAAYSEFRSQIRTVTPTAEGGSRPDLGFLVSLAVASTAAAAALTNPTDNAPARIWDLTPEAGALNGEWEEWLVEMLAGYDINPADIDPDLNPADFPAAVAR